jgi:hypothetical protein
MKTHRFFSKSCEMGLSASGNSAFSIFREGDFTGHGGFFPKSLIEFDTNPTNQVEAE